MSNIQKTTANYIDHFAAGYAPADESDYTTIFSTIDILLLMNQSNGRTDLDAEDAENKLRELGFKQMTNSSGYFWMVKAVA